MSNTSSGKKAARAGLQRSRQQTLLACQAAGIGCSQIDYTQCHTRSDVPYQPPATVWDEQIYRLRGRDAFSAPVTELLRLSIPPEDQIDYWRARRDLGATVFGLPLVAHLQHEVRLLWPDGSVRWLALRGLSYPGAGGTVARTYLVSWDITALKNQQTLQRERDVLAASSLARNLLLAHVSHEFRTPLNAILGFTQILSGSSGAPLTTRLRTLLGQVQDAGADLLALVNDTLDLASIEAGALTVDNVPVDLGRVLDQVLNWIAPRARRASVAVTATTGEGWVHADARRLSQVLINLLSSAIESSPSQGVVVVRCTPSIESDRLIVEVIDAGRGMSASLLERVRAGFNRQIEGSPDIDAGGPEAIGLGLGVTQYLLSRMNAIVSIESAPNSGTTVRVSLERASMPCTVPAAGPPSESAIAMRPLSDSPLLVPAPVQALCDVLHVDDDLASRLLVQELVALRPGLRLSSAQDIESGVAIARRTRPSLILLDLHLPDGSGAELLIRLREECGLAGGLAVAMSAEGITRHDHAASRPQGATKSFDEYFPKPLDSRAFLLALDRWTAALGRRQPQADDWPASHPAGQQSTPQPEAVETQPARPSIQAVREAGLLAKDFADDSQSSNRIFAPESSDQVLQYLRDLATGPQPILYVHLLQSTVLDYVIYHLNPAARRWQLARHWRDSEWHELARAIALAIQGRATAAGEATRLGVRWRCAKSDLFCVAWLEPIDGRASADAGSDEQTAVATSYGFVDDELRRLETSDVQEQALLAIDAIGIGVYERDYHDGVGEWNTHMYWLRGLSPDDPRPLAELHLQSIPLADRDETLAQRRALENDVARQTYDLQFRVIWPDGSLHWLASRGHMVRDSDGRLLRYIGVEWNIDSHKANEAIQVERLSLEAAARAKSRFLAGVSQQLRVPLEEILKDVDEMAANADRSLSRRQQQLLVHVQEAGVHMLGLVNDSLDLARLEAGTLAVELGVVETASVVAQALRWIRPQAERAGIRLSLSRDMPGQVRGDARRLCQVLVNLLSNAIKYNRAGGSVSLDSYPSEDGRRWVYEVIDTGRGMSAQQTARLFTPFDRLGMEREGIDGAGVGLSLVKRLLQQMNADLSLVSTVGKGTAFRVSMASI